MQLRFTFMIKGTYYYDASLAYQQGKLAVGQVLNIRPETHNLHDTHALQIFLTEAFLLGYVPKSLCRSLQPYLPFLTFTLVDIQLKGKFLALYCQAKGTVPFLKAIQIFIINSYLLWQYRLKYTLTKRDHFNDRF